jgi:hypothetical protein
LAVGVSINTYDAPAKSGYDLTEDFKGCASILIFVKDHLFQVTAEGDGVEGAGILDA